MAPKRPLSPDLGSNGSSIKSATPFSRGRASKTGGTDFDERGEFEDAWEDEFEQEDVQSNRDEAEGDYEDIEGLNGDVDLGMEHEVSGEEGTLFAEVSLMLNLFRWTHSYGHREGR